MVKRTIQKLLSQVVVYESAVKLNCGHIIILRHAEPYPFGKLVDCPYCELARKAGQK